MKKLPALKDATNMLICGEDLGMVPHSVPEVMNRLGILSLEIQRMRTGQVAVNGAAFNPTAPFGGFGQSGYGRELGPLGIEEFTAITSLQL